MKNTTKYIYESFSLICESDIHSNKNKLFLGDAEAAKNKKIISTEQIKTIISIGEEAIPSRKYETTTYFNFKLRDQNTEKIGALLPTIIDLIHQTRDIGNVLVNCFHGSSRSSSFVIGYLIDKNGMSFEDALSYVKNRRPCVSPNIGFVCQLKEFEICVNLKKEKETNK